ncbi:CUB and zona pellucida-like domain-containing protein 1 [Poecilia latipinna]|uniref:CUB and zona pellucida-like domain-containing protein 1 n=1 Tax=Poecilia latipinna TaxID=48699 RepID=UPI00072ED1BB|nr:PREDICTED: CUB and zona pellucida-like domain-containing protein 1 [Poecilia latipinna]
MVSRVLLLLQLLLLTSVISALQHWGGTMNVVYRGRNPDGSFKDSCRLSYQSTNADHRVFGFEMVVEDFPRRSIDLLYSDGSKAHKFPLIKRMKRKVEVVLVGHPLTTGAPETKQVDPPVPSCQDGLYLPRFVAPTPSDGERMVGEVEKELEVRVMAQATQSAISNLILSGPTNVTKHRDTKTEFIIRWTPTEDDLGDFYPICFAVESVNGRSVYQSEMRCVLVEIRKRQIEATVTCTESTMKVEVDKASLFGLQEDHLRLSDPSNTICSLRRHSNSSHIVAIIPLNECGTQIEEDDDYLIFKNEITTGSDDPNALITRKHLVEARFYCQYPKRGNVTLSFSAHRKNVTVWEKGFGTFTYQFEFYQNDQFEAKYDPNSYPLEFDIGNRIYMQLDASSSVNNTEMFVESCRAAPYDNPNYHPTYSIIENGCKVDPTLQINSTSNNRQFRFSMEAFKFIGLHDQVYISCTVMMCEAGNPNTRCSLGCSNSTMHNFRNKREAVIESGKHFVSQGPLRLKREADPRGGSAVNLNLNLVFVAGCLLAAVGMVCGVIIYKTKTSRVKYQPLPAYES